MVTFASATKNASTFPTRAPAQSRVTHSVAITCSDLNESCDLYNTDCRPLAQLVSPSRDPVGYHGSPWSLYELLDSKSLNRVDPSGLICAKPCEDKDRRPKWKCCADSRVVNGVDFNGDPVIDQVTKMPVPFSGGARGLTFCCDGRVVTCVYADLVRARYGNSMAQLIIIHCINEHEHEHTPDLAECPNECPDLRWGAPKKGGRTPLESECIATKKQISCLKSSLALCFGNMNCENEVQADLRGMTNHGTNVCKQAKIAFP